MALEIFPRVWFGPAGLTYKPMEMLRFTHVVNCSELATTTNIWARNDRGFLFLRSQDETDYPILERHLCELILFIEAALENPEACVYIHCVMGINRSAALAVAYRCFASKESAASVIKEIRGIKGMRPFLTNPGFVRQLEAMFPATA